MKRRLFATLFLLAATAAAAFAASPVVFYSDLVSGPNTGGKNNNGLFVTIAGKNFGASRGTGYVTIGGGRAADYPVWTDNKVTFQLGAEARSGMITVTTPDGTSNGLPFTVRAGRIFFVDDTSPNSPGSGTYEDPWRSPRSFFTAQQPGDTCYFRAGTYTGRYGSSSRPYNVSFYNSGVPSGAPDNEIAWVGYPGETALFKADDATVYNGTFEFNSNNQYFVVAGLSHYGRGDGREQVRLYSDNCRLVNNRIEGIKTLSYAMVGVTASNLKIWGNEMFGARSANKLDHIIYFQSGGRSDNVDIGWNWIHDNDIAVGPVFSWNLGSGQSHNILIHDNKIDCRNSSEILRLAGIWSGTDGSVSFVNNLIIGAGGSLNNDNAYNAIYANFGKVYVYHNTFYQSRGAGSNYVVNLYGSATAQVKNNIFYNLSNISYVKGAATVDGNLYYGGSGSVPSGDAHRVTADPRFVNGSALDLHLVEGSPAIGKGVSLAGAVPRDYDGIARPAAPAIGACEYYTPSLVIVPPGPPAPPEPPTPPAPPVTAAVSGTVRDLQGNGVSGVTVHAAGAADRMTVTAADGAYVIGELPKDGAYDITLVKSGYGFEPSTRTVSTLTGDLAGQDFTARRYFALEGYTRDKSGAGIAGATVRVSGGGQEGTVATDASGHYVFPALLEGYSYAVRIEKDGYYFDPPVRPIPVLASAASGIDFSAAAVAQELTPGEVRIVGPSAGRGVFNPERGETVMAYYRGSAPGTFECRVFTLAGDLVWHSSQNGLSNGTFEWTASSSASGIYLVHIAGPGVNVKRKVAILR